jgi:hypothetical protein
MFAVRFMRIKIKPKISMQIRIQGPIESAIQADPDPGLSVIKYGDINYE